jgi:hypothetical protein
MFMSLQPKAGKNHNVKTADRCLKMWRIRIYGNDNNKSKCDS